MAPPARSIKIFYTAFPQALAMRGSALLDWRA